jgi:hypothetical protein
LIGRLDTQLRGTKPRDLTERVENAPFFAVRNQSCSVPYTRRERAPDLGRGGRLRTHDII